MFKEQSLINLRTLFCWVHDEVLGSSSITLVVPEGWAVIPGGVGGSEDDDSLFAKPSELSPEYVWVLISSQANIEANIASDSSEDISPFTVNGVTWQGKDRAFSGEISGKLYMISLSPGFGHGDEAVQLILASLAENAG